ncbi:ACP S-malonyltransferase [Streptomyces aurantiacus]|uniref:[acyl-carrier-protein] S-malonyltransferase n=1 Tax=Streptomyces aurantiacus JA 4570 TaxID=1286094 RepID=S3ZM61_9ACTN|nr:ACP S-malonyltransferase [Streptomyces aurantiacus]EPH43874.1 putative Phthiocerol/phenolphthiocerol synthesis polyketide synthase type I PpsD [Streptomyces aurantiacus JA 4570]
MYVFPGQGSQRKGMGKDLFEKYPDLVAQADRLLGYSLRELCVDDPDRVLNRTEYTQPALYAVSALQYLDHIDSGGAPPAVVAGHSLGEYSALFAAGAFDFAAGLDLVRRRGELMSRAPKGAMAAVVNLDQERVADLLTALPHHTIDIANINSRRQCILSGVYDEVHAPEVRAAFVEAGGSFIPLNVSAAFHSRCMTDVQEEFAHHLAGVDFHELRIPVIANRTARPYPTTGYADLLVQQISSPVKWYESISWLMARGHDDFREIGPGNVLTKLTAKIREEPLTIAEPARPAPPTPRRTPRRPEIVFMYGGQGTQYHRMGRELYDTHPAFREAMDRCSALYEAAQGTSLVAAIHDSTRRGQDFDDILHTHAALYSVGWSLTEALRAEGFHPDAVLGHSLGEYVAATVAGAMSFEDGFDLVMKQAHLLKLRCRPGGMLSVLAPPALHQRRRDLFAGLALAGVNFGGDTRGNFVVSGESDRITEARAALDREGVVSVRLPVRHGFHSALLDDIRHECRSLGRAVTVSGPRVPVYSCAYAAELDAGALDRWDDYAWDVIRGRVRFDELMAASFRDPERHYFVDLSASGSFVNFLKHGYGPGHRGTFAINQFGNNTASMEKLREGLREVTGGAAPEGGASERLGGRLAGVP